MTFSTAHGHEENFEAYNNDLQYLRRNLEYTQLKTGNALRVANTILLSFTKHFLITTHFLFDTFVTPKLHTAFK